jgi:hypothetical protein
MRGMHGYASDPATVSAPIPGHLPDGYARSVFPTMMNNTCRRTVRAVITIAAVCGIAHPAMAQGPGLHGTPLAVSARAPGDPSRSAGVGSAQLRALPTPNYLTDEAGILTNRQRDELVSRLRQLEASTGHQLVILLLNSTAPETIARYADRVGNAWKVGRKGGNDGIVLVVAFDNSADLKRLRLSVGSGARNLISDDIAGSILKDAVSTAFREGRYFDGLRDATIAVAGRLGPQGT